MDYSLYDIKYLLSQGYHCLGSNFVCTLKHCKSSKTYSVYDMYVGEKRFVGEFCSLEEAMRLVRYLRRRNHVVNYILVRNCVHFLDIPKSGQLSLNL